MGFGVLFIAYFITYFGALTGITDWPISIFTYVVGAALMIYSLRKLIYENKLFLLSMISTGMLELVSVVVLILTFAASNTMILKAMVIAQLVIAFINHALLLGAILKISKDVAVTKIQARAVVNLFVTIIAGILMLLGAFLPEPANMRFFMVGVVACLIFIVFTLATIFRCYANICYEGDEHMQKETTGVATFDFLNKLLNKVINKNKDGKGKKK